MKNKDLKKGKESIIGKIIYGFLLFMPLLAIAFTCLYAVFNRNAYKSFTDETTYKQIENKNELVYNKEYRFYNTSETQQVTNPSTTQRYFINELKYFSTNYNYSFDIENLKSFNVTYYGNINYIVFYSADNTELSAIALNNNNFDIVFTLENCNMNDNQITYNFLYEVQQTNINNVFYYAVDKTEQSNLFNWSKNSIIYTGVNATCNELNITNTFIPMLLTYWLLISVIYILYDIILMILIILHNRIHRLQDSMS